MVNVILATFLLWGLSCAHITKERSEQPLEPTDQDKIHQAQDLLQSGQYGEALKAFQNFSQAHRSSVFFLESRLGEAQAELFLENFGKALEISREVSVSLGRQQSALTARAFYIMSSAQEALGDDIKALAALLDAYRQRAYLPVQVGSAEVPARLASLYGKLGRDREANQYLNLAEKGIAEATKSSPPAEAKVWLAHTYYQMGSVTTNQLSSETFSRFIEGQRWVQVYLIKALKMNDPLWSKQALQRLQLTYRDLLKVVELEANRQRQYQKASEFLEIIEQADLYKALSEHTVGTYEKDFYVVLKEVRDKVEKVLYEGVEGLGLTEAAKERNSLKRLPKQPRPEPEPVKSNLDIGEDPNL